MRGGQDRDDARLDGQLLQVRMPVEHLNAREAHRRPPDDQHAGRRSQLAQLGGPVELERCS